MYFAKNLKSQRELKSHDILDGGEGVVMGGACQPPLVSDVSTKLLISKGLSANYLNFVTVNSKGLVIINPLLERVRDTPVMVGGGGGGKKAASLTLPFGV